jgi:hypothetical protein
MRDMMRKLKLTVNENKTRVCKLAGEKFDFLGVHLWALLLTTDGPDLSGYLPVKETRATRLRGN